MKKGLTMFLCNNQHILKTGMIALALVLLSASKASAIEVPLEFGMPRPGLAANLVNKAWMDDPEYKFWTKDSGIVPTYIMALADINGDSTPEIFARHADEYLGFCNDKGICRLHIYAYTSKGFFEIGRMPASTYVAISSERTKNINNIIVEVEGGRRVTYIWNGTKYEAKK